MVMARPGVGAIFPSSLEMPGVSRRDHFKRITMRDRVIFKQTYKKGTRVNKDALPITKHTNIYQPRRMDLVAAGRIIVDGVEMEFQDVRLFFPTSPSGGDGNG